MASVLSNKSQIAQSRLSEPQPRVCSDLSRLLRSRHWAQKLKLFSPQAARNLLLGNVRSRFRGRGMEFEEVRRYQAGDDIRTIDWKVSARAGATYTKLFCEERERPCHILVDQRSHLFFGSSFQFKSVLAAELASALAWAALAGGDRVGGQVMGDFAERESRARRSKQAVLHFIHNISELNQQLTEPPILGQRVVSQPVPGQLKAGQSEQTDAVKLATSLEECRRITRPGTAIFVVSDFHDFDDAAAKALSNLGKHTDVTLLQVADVIEQELPMTGRLSMSDGQSNASMQISKELKKAYQDDLIAHQARLKSAATQARALYAQVDTSQTARQALTTIFAR